jgi:hypothetical protein
MFNNVPSKIVPLFDNVEKYCRVGQVTDDNVAGHRWQYGRSQMTIWQVIDDNMVGHR